MRQRSMIYTYLDPMVQWPMDNKYIIPCVGFYFHCSLNVTKAVFFSLKPGNREIK